MFMELFHFLSAEMVVVVWEVDHHERTETILTMMKYGTKSMDVCFISCHRMFDLHEKIAVLRRVVNFNLQKNK